MKQLIELENQYCAQNYLPIPVVLHKGEGVYLWDTNGKKYIDMMSAYSAVSHGHCHPELVDTLITQSKNLNVVSRAFLSDKLGEFLKTVCELTGQEKALPMNTGAEAVETALKAARKWAYEIKGVPKNKAEIIVCSDNFHGRTISIISLSSDATYKKNFGPLTPGFKMIPFGDANALEKAITPNTAAFLVEPIQGEAGIHIPPNGYLKQCAEICHNRDVLLICDEIQTGLGRTGKLLACDHENVKPDGLILGKALGGGLLPVSLFLSRKKVMDIFKPGDHGSTFGGNPLACAVAKKALDVLVRDKLAENSATLGKYLIESLQKINSPLIKEVRGKGLFIGLEIDRKKAKARDICLQLMEKGLLSKETHTTVVRLAPPLIINQSQVDEAIEIIKETTSES